MPLNKKGMKIKAATMKEYGKGKGKMGKAGHSSHESEMKKVGAMGMVGDKHMMDPGSMAKMKKQMPGRM